MNTPRARPRSEPARNPRSVSLAVTPRLFHMGNDPRSPAKTAAICDGAGRMYAGICSRRTMPSQSESATITVISGSATRRVELCNEAVMRDQSVANVLRQGSEVARAHDVKRAGSRQIDRDFGDQLAGPARHDEHAIGKKHRLGDTVGDQ